jgi:hypothetical protein
MAKALQREALSLREAAERLILGDRDRARAILTGDGFVHEYVPRPVFKRSADDANYPRGTVDRGTISWPLKKCVLDAGGWTCYACGRLLVHKDVLRDVALLAGVDVFRWESFHLPKTAQSGRHGIGTHPAIERMTPAADHVCPYGRCGPTTFDNLRACCYICNEQKTDNVIVEFTEFVPWMEWEGLQGIRDDLHDLVEESGGEVFLRDQGRSRGTIGDPVSRDLAAGSALTRSSRSTSGNHKPRESVGPLVPTNPLSVEEIRSWVPSDRTVYDRYFREMLGQLETASGAKRDSNSESYDPLKRRRFWTVGKGDQRFWAVVELTGAAERIVIRLAVDASSQPVDWEALGAEGWHEETRLEGHPPIAKGWTQMWRYLDEIVTQGLFIEQASQLAQACDKALRLLKP